MKLVKLVTLGFGIALATMGNLAALESEVPVEEEVLECLDPEEVQNPQELTRSVAVMQLDARNWLSLLQELPIPDGKSGLIYDGIRLARNYQQAAIEIAELTDCGQLEAAAEALEAAKVHYYGVARNYSALYRVFARDRDYRRPVKDTFSGLRTRFFYTEQLLTEILLVEEL